MNISKNSQDTFDSIDLCDDIMIVETINDDEVIEEMLCNTAY